MKKTKSLKTARLKFILAIVFLIAGIIYTISPIDLIPDLLGPVGWVDDIAALLVTFLYAAFAYFRMRRMESRELVAKGAGDPLEKK